MAYDKKKLEKKALTLIAKHKLFFISDIVAFLGISKGTFYNQKLNELDSVKDLLNKNICEVKASLRSKWYKSDAPALQMGLYKIIGTDEEAHRLNGSKQEIKHEGEIKTGAIPVEAWIQNQLNDKRK